MIFNCGLYPEVGAHTKSMETMINDFWTTHQVKVGLSYALETF